MLAIHKLMNACDRYVQTKYKDVNDYLIQTLKSVGDAIESRAKKIYDPDYFSEDDYVNELSEVYYSNLAEIFILLIAEIKKENICIDPMILNKIDEKLGIKIKSLRDDFVITSKMKRYGVVGYTKDEVQIFYKSSDFLFKTYNEAENYLRNAIAYNEKTKNVDLNIKIMVSSSKVLSSSFTEDITKLIENIENIQYFKIVEIVDKIGG